LRGPLPASGSPATAVYLDSLPAHRFGWTLRGRERQRCHRGPRRGRYSLEGPVRQRMADRRLESRPHRVGHRHRSRRSDRCLPVRGYGGTPNAVFRTMDRAASWRNINALPSSKAGFSQTLAVRVSDRAILVSGQSMLYESRDFGATRKQLNCAWDTRKIFLFPVSSSMVLGSDHGLAGC
jgi:hypothetical protein